MTNIVSYNILITFNENCNIFGCCNDTNDNKKTAITMNTFMTISRMNSALHCKLCSINSPLLCSALIFSRVEFGVFPLNVDNNRVNIMKRNIPNKIYECVPM